jgi:CRISPR-associated protein Csx14
MDNTRSKIPAPNLAPLDAGGAGAEQAATLVVTMGGQAQVVTFALDWLLDQGEPIREVMVLHLTPDDDRHRCAWRQVAAEFTGDRYRDRPCRLRLVPIQRTLDGDDFGERLADIRDERDAEATWQTVYDLLRTLKDQGRPLHLCVAGGRRMMGLLTMSAGAMLCGHADRIWHMYTPDEFLERAQNGAIMHAQPADGVRLIQAPVVPWGAYFPAVRELASTSRDVIAAHTAQLDRVEAEHCRAVYAELTDRQREALQRLAEGLSPQEAAEAMNITLATLNSHKRVILSQCRIVWGLPEAQHVTYYFIREKFGPWLRAHRSPRL